MKTSAYLRPAARNGERTISVRYTHRHKYFAVRTGLSIHPQYFDEENGTVRRAHPMANALNGVIELKKAGLMSAALQLMLRGEDPTIEKVRDQVNGTVSVPAPLPAPEPVALPVTQALAPRPVGRPKKVEELTIVSAPLTIVKGKGKSWNELLQLYSEGSVHDAASTKKDKKLFAKVVGEFYEWYKRPLSFEHTDAVMYSKLATYFLEVRGGFNNIFGKRIKEMKAFLRWCETEHSVRVHPAYKKWKVYQEEKEIVYLTDVEIDQLWSMQGLSGTMQRYRDIFVFACVTGFRWSDIIRSKQMVEQNGLLTILTQKNRGNAKVPMTNRIRTIMDRYKWDLNVVPLPKLNLAIKELAERAGLTKPVHYYRHKLREAVMYEEPMYKLLSMHSGRRSFITNAFTRGFSVPEILEMIGSSDAKVLHGYMAITGSHLVSRSNSLQG